MIAIRVHISAGCKVNPANWDSTAGIEQSVENEITKALAAIGFDVTVGVSTSL